MNLNFRIFCQACQSHSAIKYFWGTSLVNLPQLRLSHSVLKTPFLAYRHLPRSSLQRFVSSSQKEPEKESRKRPNLHYAALLSAAGFASAALAVFYLRKELEEPAYKYLSLKQPDEIRVLVLEPGKAEDPIRCHLKHVSLSSNPKFEAISYVWGNPAIRKKILCSDQKILVMTNLHAALEQLRLPDSDRILWADAVCINQVDVKERNAQVPLMRDIYSQAETVLIWLGKGSPEMKGALRALELLHKYFLKKVTNYYNDPRKYFQRIILIEKHVKPLYPLSKEEAAEMKKFDWASICVMLSSPWFTRVWTLQEYVKSSKAILVCGSQSVPFDRVSIPVSEVWLQFQSQRRLQELGLTPTFPLESMWAIKQQAVLHYGGSSQRTDLFNLVKMNNLRNCTDARDKIYGLLGMATDLSAEDWVDVQPNYDLAVEEVYKNFTLWCMKKNHSLEVLSNKRDYQVRSSLTLPSWVPDWTEEGGRRDMDLSTTRFQAGGKTTPRFSTSDKDDNVLLIKGVVIDKVQRLAISYYQMTLLEDFSHFARDLQSGVTAKQRESMSKVWLDQNIAPEYLDGLVNALETAHKYCSNVPFLAWKEVAFIEDCRDIASEGTRKMSPARFEEFWRTLIGNRTGEHDPAPRFFAWTFKAHLDFLDDVREGRRKLSPALVQAQTPQVIRSLSFQESAAQNEEVDRWHMMSGHWAEQRRKRFCSTVGGRLGWAPNPSEEGDLICIFYGAKVPYVLRPCGDGRYKLLGDAYLHGMMHGDALKIKGLKEEEFALC